MTPTPNPTAERWLPVVGFEGLYEVSDWGRIRSVDRKVNAKYCKRLIKGVVLKPAPDKDGYQRYVLSINNRQTHTSAHKVVLEAFVGPCPDGMEACHDDGDPSNNRVENLRWDTHRNNLLDKYRHGTIFKTHCKHGHEFTPGNTAPDDRGNKKCLTCVRVRAEKRRKRPIAADALCEAYTEGKLTK